MGARQRNAGRPGLSSPARKITSLPTVPTGSQTLASRARPVLLWALVSFVWATLAAAQPVDYGSEIEPIFERSCSCHVGNGTSGVELTSYDTLFASIGIRYGPSVIVPFEPDESPLIDKISTDFPRFGDRMPFGGSALPDADIALIRRWIEEGARDQYVGLMRGDVDHSERLDLSDPINLLFYLLVAGSRAPYCDPVADSNADGMVEFVDAIHLLSYIVLGNVPPPALLTEEELAACPNGNRPPEVQPLGTIAATSGVAVEFQVQASDGDWDTLTYLPEDLPRGCVIDEHSGIVRWTPDFSQAGDHRIVIRVRDDGAPPLSTTAPGLIRVSVGNVPPEVTEIGTRFGREGVAVQFFVDARDVENHSLTYMLDEAPAEATVHPDAGLFQWLPTNGDAGDHPIRVRVTDNGTPPRSTITEGLLSILDANAPVNQAPSVAAHAIYRAFPGHEIRAPVQASDPDGHSLTFKTDAEHLPEGASLDEGNGLFSWTPTADQIGPFYVPVSVEDDGVPPLSTDGLLVFRIAPIESCIEAECDSETGCDFTSPSLGDFCCGEEPEVRVAEAIADCPEGRVLHVGRNIRGFGRLQNCDRIQAFFFPQGGANVRLNVEARCLNFDEQVTLHGRLETEADPEIPLAQNLEVFDIEYKAFMPERADGYGQILALVFPLDFAIIFGLDELEALLSITATDVDGARIEKHLKLIIDLEPLPDLPDPDTQDVPPGEGGCVGCHRPLGPTGERHGIEDIHPWFELTCVDCHGGDGLANTVRGAHVRNPAGTPAFLRNLSADQLDSVDVDYLRFVNPGDQRAATKGCGSSSPANPGSGCHQDKVETMALSVMSTYIGHYTLPRFLSGSQDRHPIFAAIEAFDEDFDAATAPEGAVESVEALREPDPLADRSLLGNCMDIYLPKSCPTCHLSDFGPNNAAGNYRSSGCTACHMLYGENGLSQSDDPMINKDFPPHPSAHRLTSAIPVDQCSHCHFQGGRIGLAYQGIREGGFSPEWTPPNAEPLGRPIHDHDSRFYFVDEDTTNDHDETPPDLHHDAGMVCADCHIGGDVHGDGNLYASERYQTGIRCESCHGTVRAEVQENENGDFTNDKGFALRRVRRAEDNRILLKLAMEDREIEIPQIHRVLESGVNQAMTEAMGVNEQGFSHTDSMECYTCHTSWRQTCFGCHITIDDSRSALNRTTGLESQGAISASRDMYSTDFFALGVNHRGKITPLCSSMSILMTYINEDGEEEYRDKIRTSSDGRKGMGWNPFQHHTVSRVPQNCDQCHPVAPAAGEDNSGVLRETYGFGRRRYVVTDGDGVEHDVGAFLDEDGNLTSDFPHPNTGPVPLEKRLRAMSIEVVPHPRQEK
jgi:hypothetical protein